jgi:hypothetical protein
MHPKPIDSGVIPQARGDVSCGNGTYDKIPESARKMHTRGIHEKWSRRARQGEKSFALFSKRKRERGNTNNYWNPIGQVSSKEGNIQKNGAAVGLVSEGVGSDLVV